MEEELAALATAYFGQRDGVATRQYLILGVKKK
jgi:hypothetical protein